MGGCRPRFRSTGSDPQPSYPSQTPTPPTPQFDANTLLQNYLYLQNLSQFVPQNPFLPNPNFQFQSPNIPFQNPNFYPLQPETAASFPVQNSYYSDQQRSASINRQQNADSNTQRNNSAPSRIGNPKFPVQLENANANRRATLERIEAAVANVRRELIDTGESVSAWKVSQLALVKLQADSWDSLGLQLQEVPSLHRLILTEGKINAFIHCYVAVWRITSLHELELAICTNEGVEQFEELELGPLIRHPLAVHYFSVNKEVTEVYKITSKEIIYCLSEYINAQKRKKVDVEQLLHFIAEKYKVSSREKLGVRIQSLGMHITFIREAQKSENLVLKKFLGGCKNESGSRRKKRPLLSLQKQQLDDRFSVMAERVTSFASVHPDFCGKHIRFSLSGSDDDDSDTDTYDGESKGKEDVGGTHNQCQIASLVKTGDRLSSCPYPSEAEEMTRLGLRGEKTPPSQNLTLNEAEGSYRKKRKLDNRSCSTTASLNLSGSKGIESTSRFSSKGMKGNNHRSNFDLSLSTDSIRFFISTWKEACHKHSAAEVLDKMLKSYKKRKRVKSAFYIFPLLGLLNVAVTSIKSGMWDSIYDTFQSMDQVGKANSYGDRQSGFITIDCEDQPVKCREADSLVFCKTNLDHSRWLTAEDIIKKASEYFACKHTALTGANSLLDRIVMFSKNLCLCEAWLAEKFSVKKFSSLGHGEYFTFMERYASLLSKEVNEFVKDSLHDHSVVVSMLQQQLVMLLSQASNNLWEGEGVTKDKISELLIKQFPFLSFYVIEGDNLEDLLNIVRQHKSSIIANSVLFSATLLGTTSSNNSLHNEERDIDPTVGAIGHVTSKDAVEVLLKAPMLSDLSVWSHWNLIYAPTLGPLLEWLLKEVNEKSLLCILTKDCRIIRIDHTAAVDSFFEALLKRSPFEVAVQLVSLLALSGGNRHVPLSLLKCQARQAFEVIMLNTMQNSEMNYGMNCVQRMSGKLMTREADLTSLAYMSSSNVNKALPSVSRDILDCLCYLPSEFRSFAADVLLSGLRSVMKDTPSAILLQCRGCEERLMLHDIGFSLGISEWIEDHHSFCPITESVSTTPGGCSPLISMSQNGEVSECMQDTVGGNSFTRSEMPVKDEASEGAMNISTSADNPDFEMSETIELQQIADVSEQKDATHIIEAIRREEFGLNPNVSAVQSDMLKKQHARLGRALLCLSQELYSQDSHFILELVQNADDNVYPDEVEPTLTFILEETCIVVLNNERGFTEKHIRALCDVGNSTKKGSSTGYIGQKGIGFKSVFRVTDAPEIHSNGFHIKFDIAEGQIGFVLPTIISPCNVHLFNQLAFGGADKMANLNWSTCIVLPFKSKLLEGSVITSIISMFADLHPSLLLFLHRLKCINFRNMLNDSFVVMRKEILGNGIVKVTHGQQKLTWFVASKKLHPAVIRANVKATEISIAFPLKESEKGGYEPLLEQQPVFAFLPLRTYGLKFILQADFVLPSSREEVDGDSPWNQWLLSEFPDLFVSAEKSMCALPCFQENPGEAVTACMSFVPLIGEVHGFFSSLPRMIISKLRVSNCMLQDGRQDEWVPPCKVLRGWNADTRMLLPDILLYEHLGLRFLHKDIILSDSLSRALGVVEYGPKTLVQFLSSLCSVDNGLKSVDMSWLFSCLNELYRMVFHSSRDTWKDVGMEFGLLNSLKKVPFIPLSDGTYSCLDEGTIWVHADSVASGFDGDLNCGAFPNLYTALKIVSPALFSAATSGGDVVNNCIRMLEKVGVQRLSAHEIIKIHILPYMTDGELSDKDRQLMVEYAAFLMIHLQSSCGDCHVEREHIISELRNKAFILTNFGYKRPSDVSIHFSKEYGNSIDAKKLILTRDYEWHEVDVLYLKHPATETLSGGATKWRQFLQNLGVTDFVKIVQVDRTISDLSPALLKQITWERDLVIPGLVVKDWESQELVHILHRLSQNHDQGRCKYLLEILDTLWDDHFSEKVRGYCCSNAGESSIPFKSSLMSSICDVKWIASSMDKELHYPRDLFYDCEVVQSILGSCAPYAVPKIRNEKLLREIGFKAQLTLDDMLVILQMWRRLEPPFTASILQMSKFYTSIWREFASSRQKVIAALSSGPFIFIPYLCSRRNEDFVTGVLVSPDDVYWYDSSGAVNHSKEHRSLIGASDGPLSKSLCTVYPGLHDFFVNECGVKETPPFRHYLQILQQLSNNALPHEAAKSVFQVLLRWSDGLKCGTLSPDDIVYFKECLLQFEFTVLPTMQDKWVSLHPSFGLVCWCDDDILKKEFKHLDNIRFLYFGELNGHEKEKLQPDLFALLRTLGIPALSEVVTREAIYYGPADCSFKTSLVAWALPFAQRYIYNLHLEKYSQLKLSEFMPVQPLKIVVVEELFYRNVIKRINCASKKRSECSTLLQDKILYTTKESDSHSLFLELSRLFFGGSPELHLANFLHMITTMAESGSTEEQTEFFILNSQKMPKLPDEEATWSLSSPSPQFEIGDALLANNISMNITEHCSSKLKKKPGLSSWPAWPPVDWKTAPSSSYYRASAIMAQGVTRNQGDAALQNNEGYSDGDGTLPPMEDILPLEINEDMVIEEDTVIVPESTAFPLSETVVDQPDPVHSQPQTSAQPLLDPLRIAVESVSPGDGPFKSNQLSNGASATQQETGRLGEHVAFTYFTGKLGEGAVNWVNREKETGLPYDIVVGEKEGSKEYIEVKATRFAKKNWFTITMREWQFADEKGDSFSIAHVTLSTASHARITIYKNPVKLCQLGKLQLAICKPR